MTPTRIRRAASILRREALGLKYSFQSNGKWPDHNTTHREAHRDHDEMIRLAKQLDRLADASK